MTTTHKIRSHEDYRHARSRLLRDLIRRDLVGLTLDKAGVLDHLPQRAYGSGGVETVFGFYDVIQTGPQSLRERLPAIYGKDEAGLAEMVQKAEAVLGEAFVERYAAIKHYSLSHREA